MAPIRVAFVATVAEPVGAGADAAVDRPSVGRCSYPRTFVWSCTSKYPGTMEVCSASAAVAVAAGEVAVVGVVAPKTTPCFHLSHTPVPLPIGHPPVRILVLDTVVAAGRDSRWAPVDLGRHLAAGSVAVAAAVGPNVWTMRMMMVCSLSRVHA